MLSYVCLNIRRKNIPVRCYSQFKASVHLPQTSFPLKINDKAKHENEIQQICKFDDLYKWQLNAYEKNQSFILHDGPPYANGDVHVGHALNKILKDITNRFKLLSSFKIHYKPGWDCHGLPIEIKAIKSKTLDQLSALEIRKRARAFAENTIVKQKAAFKMWGVMANWDNPEDCYYTFNPAYQEAELKYFYSMYKKNLIYRDLKPIYWSPSSKTALAESELEYNEKHISRSVFVTFPIMSSPLVPRGEKAAVLVWTTQPWTLPANQALCYNCNDKYSFVKVNDETCLYLVASNSLPHLINELGCSCECVDTFDGSNLCNLKCTHPMDSCREVQLVPAAHAQSDKGTGIVHTAPAHGIEDFQVAMQHSLPLESNIDSNGCFTAKSGYGLEGKYIFDAGNTTVIDIVKQNNNLVHVHDFVHSFPYDWRTKKEVFVQTSRQWFIDTNQLKAKALSVLSDVEYIPQSGKATMKSVLQSRPYWCISRQRVWGVPIPVFYHKESGEVLINDVSMKHIQSLIKKHGSDVWFTSPIDQLLPEEAILEAGYSCSSNEFQIGKDILDIWFDSGISWAAVLNGDVNGKRCVADMYLEGKDQYNGWFQSSILTSIGLQGAAPYKSVMVHGFCVAEDGQKMSKSLGNVIDPNIVVKGGKNKVKDPCYGADAMRWWVAQSNMSQTLISKTILNDAAASVQKVRSSLRYLLSNLKDFDPNKLMTTCENMTAIDQYYLFQLKLFVDQVTDCYNNYKYTMLCRIMMNFITNLSATYFSIIKDRLYCEEKDGSLRLSAQTAVYHILEALIKSVAPILPHLAEEAVLHHPCSKFSSAFKDGWINTDALHSLYDTSIISSVTAALTIREAVFSLMDKNVQSTACNVFIIPPTIPLLSKLQSLNRSKESDLCQVLSCASCTFLSTDQASPELEWKKIELKHEDETIPCSIAVQLSNDFKCPRCRKVTSESVGDLCSRCTRVLSDGWDM